MRILPIASDTVNHEIGSSRFGILNACSVAAFLIFNRLSARRMILKMPEESLSGQFAPYVPRKGEEYMSERQLAHFRSILENRKADLIRDIERTVHTMQDEATIFADPNDRASQETDIAIELRNRDRGRKMIKKIEDTIALIDSGDYGYCSSCGAEIGIKRLEVRPTASLCIDCKTLEEVREKQVAK
jgi:DnaK suppressor protein